MKKILFVLLFALSCGMAHADVKLPQSCTASLPKELLKGIIKESEVNTFLKSGDWGQSSKSGKFWTAYSDRSNNTTYQGPSESSGKYGELEFNEPVRIAEINGNFALIYSEKQKGLDYPHISTSAEPKGWIPMKNLLLWGACPTNEKGIYNKALIVMNLDEVKAGKNEDLGKRYMNPDTRGGARKLVSNMNFYFVMKKADNGLILLSSECKMEGYTGYVLYGWVSPSSIVPWSQRTCLEPNWKPTVAEQMAGQSVPVYKKSDESMKGCEFPLGRKNNVTDVKSTMYRMGPQEMRYPLLSNDSQKDDLYKVTAFARPDGSAHVSVVPEGTDDGTTAITEGGLGDKSVINLIVVIDGTSSMENYYPPTQEIIKRAYDYFGKDNGNKVNVGVVIYRDYTDGQYVTEHLTMRSPTDPKVADFLTKGGEYGVKSSPSDKTYAEALYKGLEMALDEKTMGYSSKNSNLMFVIGDCGNDLSDTKCLSAEAIIKKCVENNVQINAFQVRNVNEQSFLSFRNQMGEIVNGTLRAQYKKLTSEGGKFKAGFKELPDGYEFKTDLPENQNFYLGSTRNAPLGKDMDISKLYDIVKDSYMQFSGAIDAAKRVIHNGGDILRDGILRDGDSNTAEATGSTIDLAYLKTVFTPEQIETLKKNNNLMAFQGYTPKKSSSDMDYWQPIIYISSDEFANLMEKLQPVMTAASGDNKDRKPYIEAVKALTRSMLPDITESEMNEMGTEEVMSLVSGLNETTGAQKHKIIEIGDESKVSQADFDAMIAEFRNKFNKLKKIREQKYPFSIERNKTTWYWVPVDDLP